MSTVSSSNHLPPPQPHLLPLRKLPPPFHGPETIQFTLCTCQIPSVPLWLIVSIPPSSLEISSLPSAGFTASPMPPLKLFTRPCGNCPCRFHFAGAAFTINTCGFGRNWLRPTMPGRPSCNGNNYVTSSSDMAISTIEPSVIAQF